MNDMVIAREPRGICLWYGYLLAMQVISLKLAHSGVYEQRMSLPSTDTFHSFIPSTRTTGLFHGLTILLEMLTLLPRSSLPPSKQEFPLRGLNLIRLLTQNRIADFHTTLESLPLPADEINLNPYIRHPVNLERWLMEGSYSKVWNAREEAPAEEYKFFVDSLMGTIRYVTVIQRSGFSHSCVGMKLQVAKRRRMRVFQSRTRPHSCSSRHSHNC